MTKRAEKKIEDHKKEERTSKAFARMNLMERFEEITQEIDLDLNHSQEESIYTFEEKTELISLAERNAREKVLENLPYPLKELFRKVILFNINEYVQKIAYENTYLFYSVLESGLTEHDKQILNKLIDLFLGVFK